MSDEPQALHKHVISDKGKHRLRIAARFLRQEGHRFDGDNFYDEVINAIRSLNEKTQCELRGRVDWVEGYEVAELVIHGEPPRSCARKIKTKSGKKGALHPRASGADAYKIQQMATIERELERRDEQY